MIQSQDSDNESTAEYWFQKAAAQGDSKAKEFLEKMKKKKSEKGKMYCPVCGNKSAYEVSSNVSSHLAGYILCSNGCNIP